jgi:hypothetical protein
MKRSSLLITALVILAFACSEQDNLRENQIVAQEQSKHGKLKKNSRDLSVEVIRAPIAPDKTSAAASTDIVLNFRDLDPDTNGITIKTGGSIEVVLPDAFTNTGSGTNIGIILQGWPQSPPEPPPFTFWTTNILGNTITITMLKDFLVGDFGPGPKQVHLALFGFTNPGPGMYPISLSITPTEGGDTQSGTGYVHIIPKARPAVSAVSLFSGGGPPPPFNNAIYQTVEQGQGNAANTVGLYLWESRRKALIGANIEMKNLTHGRLVKSNGSTAGQVRISPPPGASDYILETEGPSTAGSAFLSGVEVGILKTTFIPDPNVLGDYTIEIKMNNGNTQYLYVEVIP